MRDVAKNIVLVLVLAALCAAPFAVLYFVSSTVDEIRNDSAVDQQLKEYGI